LTEGVGRAEIAPFAVPRRFPERLHTPRLIIRQYTLADAPALFGAVNRSRTALLEFMPWARTSHLFSEDTEAWIARERARWVVQESELGFGMFRRDGGYVGGIGVHAIDWSVPRFELGYWLDSQSVGHGYMQEAVRATARACFEKCGATRVEIRCDVRNSRSARVARACGFVHDGTLRAYSRGTDGTLRDTMVWGMTASDAEGVRADWDASDAALAP
jgi:RimJ/RimL family protein N-acetyltransferase